MSTEGPLQPEPAQPDAAALEALLAFVQANGRVCPLPQQWQTLYDRLPAKRRAGGGWAPALPLILAAWHDTPAMLKMLRLREHLEWAAAHGALAALDTYLRGLREDQWHHLGD